MNPVLKKDKSSGSTIITLNELSGYLNSVCIYQCDETESQDHLQGEKIDEYLKFDTCSTCVCCEQKLHSLEDQRVHFKSESHKINIEKYLEKRRLDDDNGLSCKSESEDEDTNEEFVANLSLPKIGKTFFVNSNGQILSLFTVLIKGKNDDNLLNPSILESLPQRNKWAIIMLSGGNFAAAVFHGAEIICHKAFHSYTVRAGQGGSQSSKDNQSGTRHPNSAGSSLRRYNEMSFFSHFQEVMKSWKDVLEVCDFIFYRIPNSNVAVIFGGKNPCFAKNDPRLRKIPLPTRKPTYKEVQRIHRLLYSIQIFDNERDFFFMMSKNESIKKPSPVTTEEKVTSSAICETQDSSSSDEEELIELTFSNVTFHTNELNPYECYIPKARQKRTSAEPTRIISEREQNLSKFKNQIYSYCHDGNLARLEDTGILYIKYIDSTNEDESNEILKEKFWSKMKTEVFGQQGKSLLHITSQAGNHDMIRPLLVKEQDPTLKTADGKTAYHLARSKKCKEEFRRFMAQFPEKYDYTQAGILVPLTDDMVRAKDDKKKLERKLKKEREKARKEALNKAKKEEEEKKRYLELSDREKRALAAERRMLKDGHQVVARCFTCGLDITGKVPFEYLSNRFCSTSCVKSHRQTQQRC